jgi:hypothetical protein
MGVCLEVSRAIGRVAQGLEMYELAGPNGRPERAALDGYLCSTTKAKTDQGTDGNREDDSKVAIRRGLHMRVNQTIWYIRLLLH